MKRKKFEIIIDKNLPDIDDIYTTLTNFIHCYKWAFIYHEKEWFFGPHFHIFVSVDSLYEAVDIANIFHVSIFNVLSCPVSFGKLLRAWCHDGYTYHSIHSSCTITRIFFNAY